jgi:hypothetical protein
VIVLVEGRPSKLAIQQYPERAWATGRPEAAHAD